MWMTETQLAGHGAEAVSDYFRNGQEGQLCTADGLRLHYRLFLPAKAQTMLVLANGRTETVGKYQELIYELGQLGIAVAAMDHRGQGLSERQSADQQLGHVLAFDDYVTDLNHFVSTVVLPLGFSRHWLLAHSMGSCISALYLARYHHPFSKVVMTSPMFGIATKPFPGPVARALARVQSWLDQRRGQPRYLPTTGPYQPAPFADNGLTHSPLRYQRAVEYLQEQPQSRLGGPSAQWLNAAFQAMQQALVVAKDIRVPVLVIVAEADPIVTRKAQQQFAQALPDGRLILIDGGWHELLLESDDKRQQTLDALLAFFSH